MFIFPSVFQSQWLPEHPMMIVIDFGKDLKNFNENVVLGFRVLC